MDEADDDPTIICNMLEEFRANANSYYRSSMLPTTNSFSSTARSRKLNFDSSSGPQLEKRMKLASPKRSEMPKEGTI